MKKIVRNFLNRYGYDIIKTEAYQLRKGTKEKKVKVGKFIVCMPENNIQLANYKLHPNLNAPIGRLAVAVQNKYSEMTAIDVGANVGDTIAVIKSVVDCPIIGIEGDDISYKFLEKNVRQFDNVSIVKTFLGEKKETLNVRLENDGWNTTIIPTDNGEKAISFKTLDELIDDQFDKHNLKFLKLDVEGFDTIVLRGAYKFIEKHKPVILFEYNRDVMKTINEDGLSTLLSFGKLNYNKILFFDHLGRLLLTTSLQNEDQIIDLHNYAITKANLLGYFDICLFHKNDNDIAHSFLNEERKHL